MAFLTHICFQIAGFFATICILSRCRPGDCQQQFSADAAVGPRDLTRYEHEANVYIPCPFSGSSNPIWRINGIDYEAFNLPLNMLPVSYGLLIPSVELGMDGKSFQCVVQPGQSQELRSSIGTLTVEKLSQEFNMTLYHEYNAALQTSSPSTALKLKHRDIIFDSDYKTFSWVGDNICNTYRVTKRDCDDNVLDQDIIIQRTKFAIPTSSLIDRSNLPLYFKLESINGNDGTICHRLQFYLAVKQSDVTVNQSTSYDGVCVDVKSEINPYVVLPSKTMGSDCSCPIYLTINNSYVYNLTNCNCAPDTIFTKSFFVYNQTGMTNTYKMCFLNLTNEMNNTVIHFYSLYRECINSNGRRWIRPFRLYLKSMKLVIELPRQPHILVNITTGEVTLSLNQSEGIELDHYRLTLSDVTGFNIIHRHIDHDNTSFDPDIFQQSACFPYNLTVRTYSVLNSSVSMTKMITAENNDSEESDECACIAEYVHVELNWTNIGESGRPEIEVHVNCSQLRYEDKVMVQVEVKHGDVNDNVTFTTLCETKKPTQPYTIYNLDCDKAYNIIPCWMSEANKCCQLDTATYMKVQCPSVTTEKTGSIDIVSIAGFSTLGVTQAISIIVIITLISVYCYRKMKNGKSEIIN